MAEVFVAKQSAVIELDGRPVPIKRGTTRVEEGHELLTRYPTLFEPAGDTAHFRVTRQEPAVTPRANPKRAPRGSRAKKSQPAAEDTQTPQDGTTSAEGTEAPASEPEMSQDDTMSPDGVQEPGVGDTPADDAQAAAPEPETPQDA